MSEAYKGLTVPSYSDAADGPAAFRSMVDSGPIPRFATAAARDAAITTPIQGQVVYRQDLGTGASLEIWNGSAWVNLTQTSVPDHTHDSAEIDTGVLAVARIPNLDTAKITTGVFPEARLPNASTSAQGVVQLANSVGSSTTLAATQALAEAIWDKALDRYGFAAGAVAGRRIFIQASTPVMANGDVWFKI